ncbi:Bifunctional nuclease [Thalictrum thalictroides]|uniref:Bifunctional nuclease n=1 Tax=Thalictrum thalictroides TaxID=46969 RepID=A0A7J6VZL3_THATH|nr:Bifunctional nuclease [Thalictrum thalictroides]
MDSEDDMHDANDVDSLEDVFYSGETALDNDSDDEGGYAFIDNDSDDSDNTTSHYQLNYTILSDDDIQQRQEEDITRISIVLSLSRVSASILLRHYNWCVSKVHDAWFADEEKVRKIVVEVKSGSDAFMIKMRDGKYMRCIHNSPQGGHLADYAPHPAIVLKMEDGSDLLLPIIVLEMPSTLLMAAIRNVQIARPTLYQVMVEMVEKMGYVVKLVRVTKRVHEAYIAQLYVSKVGNETDIISFDLRPSDAINIAVRCKVPIQVNKYLAYSDGMRVIEPAKLAARSPLSDGLLFTELDRPDGKPCVEAKEFDLIRNMLIAAVEERYRDAAQWRDKLSQLRSKKHKWA